MIGNYGVDVSSYQKHGLIPWDDIRIRYGIVKCTENLNKDPGVAGHVADIRAAQVKRDFAEDLKLGLYHFFHSETDPKLQFDNFCKSSSSVGYENGDIVPAVDLECYKNHAVTPAWNASAEKICGMMKDKFGGCLPYISWSTWVQLGKPSWVLQYPIWCPMYAIDGHLPFNTCSHSPGNKTPKIFQSYVGPLFGLLDGKVQNSKANGAVDQNQIVDGTPAEGHISQLPLVTIAS